MKRSHLLFGVIVLALLLGLLLAPLAAVGFVGAVILVAIADTVLG